MATTTAAVTLTSDLLSDNMSVSASSTLMKAGTTADGLDQMEYGYINLPTGDEYDLIATTPTAGKASKLYLKNHSTDETYYIAITQNAQAIGRLYGGDWMFIPWCAASGKDIEFTASDTTETTLEYTCFYE